jgi:acetate---CoA ligase (ADP-forming) subunit beta
MQDEDIRRVLREARARGLDALDEPAGKKILAAAGIRVPRAVVVAAGGDLREAVAVLKAPLVLKLIATGVVHKSDVGGVKLHLIDGEAVARAAAELEAALQDKGIRPDAWLVEEMAPRGVEVVAGGMQDPEFGPMVMVGLGGIFVEVLHDVAFRICPITRSDALDMIQELKGAALLHGARGTAPVSIDAIVDVLLRLGGEDGLLLSAAADVAEIDVNPLIVSARGAVAVDARFILK